MRKTREEIGEKALMLGMAALMMGMAALMVMVARAWGGKRSIGTM